MKKLFVLICAAIVSTPLFAGDDRAISVDRFPAPARQFIDLHFKDVKVVLSTVDREMFDTTYEVFFADGRKVEFDSKGAWSEIDCHHARVPDGAIPEAIRRYIADNYPERYVTEIDRDRRDYEVKLDSGLELTFDLQFRLIGIDD